MAKLKKPLIYVALPNYDGKIDADLAAELIIELPKYNCHVQTLGGSLLTLVFNKLWCEALNIGADYFLMVHADVRPISDNWIKVMLNEIQLYKADALSVVLPIKSDKGLTSTALGRLGDKKQRRLSSIELSLLPPSFGVKELAKLFNQPTQNSQLLINTGLLLVDLKRHRKLIEKLKFQFRNEIIKNQDNKLQAFIWPEDWCWSHDASKLGLKVMATSKIKANHIGKGVWINWLAWGQWDTDREYQPTPKTSPKK